MAEKSFADDWRGAKELGRFSWLHSWKIQSVREYISKNGHKAHVVFELKKETDSG
jgi:hypothetical protein